jgi:hypothetical protein
MIPAIYQYREFAAAGGLLSYGGRLTDMYRLVGVYMGRIQHPSHGAAGSRPLSLQSARPARIMSNYLATSMDSTASRPKIREILFVSSNQEHRTQAPPWSKKMASTVILGPPDFNLTMLPILISFAIDSPCLQSHVSRTETKTRPRRSSRARLPGRRQRRSRPRPKIGDVPRWRLRPRPSPRRASFARVVRRVRTSPSSTSIPTSVPPFFREDHDALQRCYDAGVLRLAAIPGKTIQFTVGNSCSSCSRASRRMPATSCTRSSFDSVRS